MRKGMHCLYLNYFKKFNNKMAKKLARNSPGQKHLIIKIKKGVVGRIKNTRNRN
jgi:hypothetical protein